MDPKSQRIIIVCLGACVLTVVGYAYIEFRRRIGAMVGPAPARRPITERRVDGHAQLTSHWFLLGGLKPKDGGRVEWSAKFNANPAKPAFIFSLRCLQPGWGIAEAKRPIGWVCDDRRSALKATRGVADIGTLKWSVLTCAGTLDDLRACAKAERVAVDVGGVEYNLGHDGVPTLAELLRRSGK